MVDHLTDVLRGLRLDGVEYVRSMPPCTMPWAATFEPGEQAYFHFVAAGSAWLGTGDGDWVHLTTGDAVLLPRGSRHVLASKPGLVGAAFETLKRTAACEGIVDIDYGCETENNLHFTASMEFNLEQSHPLLKMMPEIIKAADLAAAEPAIISLLDAMSGEVAMKRVGAGGILARLADVLTATIIRAWVEAGSSDASGWLAAIREPEIGHVLGAIHRDPARDWTVGEMATLIGISRSGFSHKFTEIVGETPAKYVMKLRMSQGQQWLRNGERVAAVAEKLDYDSEASFSRAFKRIIGKSPSQCRPKKNLSKLQEPDRSKQGHALS